MGDPNSTACVRAVQIMHADIVYREEDGKCNGRNLHPYKTGDRRSRVIRRARNIHDRGTTSLLPLSVVHCN